MDGRSLLRARGGETSSCGQKRPSLCRLFQQACARFDDGELHWLVANVEPAVTLPRHRKGGAGEIALVGKVLTVVRTTAVLALEPGQHHDFGDLHQAAQVQPIVPREVK